MRISDWSSDVCSSGLRVHLMSGPVSHGSFHESPSACALTLCPVGSVFATIQHCDRNSEIGRASCREKSVSVRVVLGGGRIIKKKKNEYSVGDCHVLDI